MRCHDVRQSESNKMSSQQRVSADEGKQCNVGVLGCSMLIHQGMKKKRLNVLINFWQ